MECGSSDGVPIVAGVTGFGLGEAGEGGIVWVVVAAEFINHQIQRRNDIEAKSPGSGFEKGILRRASDMAFCSSGNKKAPTGAVEASDKWPQAGYLVARKRMKTAVGFPAITEA